MNQTDRNAYIYNALNDIDDRRERIERASSTGRHEPSSAFGGLYHVEEVDDGGRLIERHERGIVDAFVSVADLPDTLRELVEPGVEELANAPLDIGKKPSERLPSEPQIEEIRYLAMNRENRPAVILRRKTTLRAV